MDNFLLGMQAILSEAGSTVVRLGSYPLLWGFATGFLTSTLVHAFLMTGRPSQLPSVLFENKSENVQLIHPPNAGGTFTRSYVECSHTVDRIKVLMLSGFLGITLLLLFIALTR